MATTYNSTTTSPTPKDRARKLLGDTGVDGGVFLLTDEEIDSEIATLGFNEAVAQLAMGLASRFAQYPDKTDTPGGSTVEWRERIQQWKDLAAMIRNAPDPTDARPRRTVAKLGQMTNPANPKIR